jgi:adenylate cyclase
MSLFNELKRRNVFKAVVGYIITAWLVLQIADVVLNNIEAPGWIFQVFMLFLGLGLPIVIVFAWAFEMTPEGLKRESEVDRSQSITPETGRKLNYSIIAVLVLALGYFAYDKFFVAGDREAALVKAATQSASAREASAGDADIDRSIAVLPFADMSPDKDQEYFTDGLSEELLNLLAKIPELKVASRSSAFQFKDKGVDIKEVAKQLGVAHVLEGSVRKDGKQLRITAQLIKADDGFHMWSETYDRELKGVFAIQDEISAAVVEALKVTLLGEAPKARETDPEAYAFFLQGRYLVNAQGEENGRNAAIAFQSALAIDPVYAPAFAGLSEVYLEQTNYGFINAIEGMVLSRSMSERAISLDPESAEAWYSLSRIRWAYDWDWEGAGTAAGKALELEPGNVHVISQSARLKMTFGLVDEAIQLQQRAVTLDPLSLRPLLYLAQTLRNAGKLEESAATFRRVLTLNPQHLNAHSGLAEVLILKGKPEDALMEAEKEVSEVWKGYVLPIIYHALNRADDSRDALESFINEYGSVGAFQVTANYAFQGEKELAFEWLERAYAQRDGGLTELLNDQFLMSLHDDPRWELFVDKMNLLQFWHAKKEREALAGN